MKKICLLLTVVSCQYLTAQLYVAPGDSISVVPGTLFTLQEDLINNGKIYNNGVLTLNGTAAQNISGSGNTDNLTADNNTVMLSDGIINNTLQLNAGKIFSLGNFHLTNSGSITGSGLLNGSANASITLNGNSSTLQFDQSTDAISNALKTLTVNNSSTTLQNKLYVYDAMLPSAGNITLNDELVLRSNSGKTARVGIVGSSFVYGSNGKFVIERYVPGNRAWRLLTAPVTAADNVKISDAWQDGKPRVTNVNIISNPEPGYGTHVTFGFPSTNGYDQGVNGNPSIRYLNGTGWNGIPSATNDGSIANSGIITDQAGYMLFVRGDRGTLLSQATSAVTSPTVLRPKGSINSGLLNLPLGAGFISGGSHFRVIGNPYPCSINFHAVITNPVNNAAGFADAFYLWDPNITGTNGVGGFVGMTYNAAASIIAGKPVYDRSVASSIANDGDIQSSAAFVIDYSGPETTLRVEENHKSIESNTTFFRAAGQLQTNLVALNADSSLSLNDGVLISFDKNNNAAVDKYDLKKLGNFAENISVINNGTYLSIEKRQPLAAGDTVFYFVKSLRQKKYQLHFDLDTASAQAGTGVFLEDRFLQKKEALRMNGKSMYPFDVNADTGSFRSYRFRLVCKNVNRFTQLLAVVAEGNVQLKWMLTDTSGAVFFTVQRSADGLNFENIHSTQNFYSVDIRPQPGIYYYRIKCVNDKGVETYSNVQRVKIHNIKPGLQIFPNPVKGDVVWVSMKNAAAGKYFLTLLTDDGKEMQVNSFLHMGGLMQYQLPVSKKIKNGMYQLKVTMPGGTSASLSMLVQR